MAVIWMAGGNEIALKEIPAGVSQIVNVDAAQHVHPRLFPHITGMSDIAFLAGILLRSPAWRCTPCTLRNWPNPRRSSHGRCSSRR